MKRVKRFLVFTCSVLFFAVIVIFLLINARAISQGEFSNLIKCKVGFGDWIELRGSWVTVYECGFNKTADAGKYCVEDSDCILDCVEKDPVSDMKTINLVRDGENYYYYESSVSGSICQTHEKFLNNITHRKKYDLKLITPEEVSKDFFLKSLKQYADEAYERTQSGENK